MKSSKFAAAAAFGLLSMGFAGSSFAQQAQPGQPGGNPPAQPGGNNGRTRGNFDPAQFRAQYMARIKEQLGANDDEWKVLEPKITKAMDASRATRGSGGFSGRTRGGAPGGGAPGGTTDTADQSPVAKASADLRAVVDNKSAPAAEYTAKLAAYRAAREKAKADSLAAQKELKELLTPRQEAVLVSSGIIE